MKHSIIEVEKLHRKYSASQEVSELVFTHCKIVWEIAEQIIDKQELKLDKSFIETAALLHDIGAYKFISADKEFDGKNYIRHGVVGYEILQSEGYDESICEIARRHTGVGLTKKEIVEKSLPLPPADYLARTKEERLIMFADKFHSKSPKFNSYETYAKFVLRFGEEKVVKLEKLKEEFGVPELDLLARKYNHPLI